MRPTVSSKFDLQMAMVEGKRHVNVYVRVLRERVLQLESLLRDARCRLDAPYCEGRLCGPDGALATEIDEALKISG